MNKRFELPVNKKHFMKSSITRAGLYSIMSSDEYVGSVNAIVSDFSVELDNEVNEYLLQTENFCIKTKNCELSGKDRISYYQFSSSPQIEDKYAYIYKKIECNPELYCISIKIDYLQESNAFSNIKIIFSNGYSGYDSKFHEIIFDSEYCLKLSAKGILVFRSSYFHRSVDIFSEGKRCPVYLKLVYNKAQNYMEALYSYDGNIFSTVGKEEVENIKFIEAGVYLAPKVNPFFYDFYLSHINLCIDLNLNCLLLSPEIEERYFSNMLDVYQIPRELFNFDNSIINTFIVLLSKGYYIRLRLEEYYIQGKFQLEHSNFVYGFDLNKKKFLVIGYHKHLEFFELDFSSFMQAVSGISNLTDKITLYKYNSKYYPDKLNENMLILNLKAYVNGDALFALNSNKAVMYDKKMPVVCGIKVYDEIVKSEKCMNKFIEDIRMAHQILEHNLIIIDLLKFLKNINLISNLSYQKNMMHFQENLKISENIKNIVLKNKIKPIKDIKIKIQNLLEILARKDEIAMKLLIEELD